MAMSINSSMSPTSTGKNTIRSITLTAMLLAILIVQEEVLVFIPNVQLTTLLIMAYSAVLPTSLLLILIPAYVLIDSLLMASLNPIYMIPMVFAWLFLAFLTKAIKNKPFIWIVIVAVLFGFLYGWSFIPSKMLTMSVFEVWPYVLSDLPFEVIMAVTNLFTVGIMYRPIVQFLKTFTVEENKPN